ncbi:MAG TPA: hypothetical protein VFC39_08600 [Acidobacteriaceae bacterium]|nr:hypothetical protein [Acidobacteriaceae bacterium]
MGQLEDNLKLGLEAVKYAKGLVKRSANQTYFKPLRPQINKKRNEFILGATRGGNFLKNQAGKFTRNDIMANRRNELYEVISGNLPLKQKEARIDVMRNVWGEDYFWQGTAKWELEDHTTIQVMAKVTGKPEDEVRTAMLGGGTEDMIDLYNTYAKARKAIKYGVGNCQEKAEVACTYIMDHAPGGVRLALYALERGHKGVTGLITGEPGDHVFGVYGLNTVTDNIGTLGPDAIIVDGWMNDAYPARKYLDWKHGYNYNDERINLKQFTVRNMVCVSYRAHVECMRDFGVLPAGPGGIPVPPLKRKKF